MTTDLFWWKKKKKSDKEVTFEFFKVHFRTQKYKICIFFSLPGNYKDGIWSYPDTIKFLRIFYYVSFNFFIFYLLTTNK